MDKLKGFKSFIKENADGDNLDNKINDIDQDDILMNMKDLPSELWTPDMVDAQKEFENNNSEEGDLDHIDDEVYDEGDGDDKKMMHKQETEVELSEKKKSSEEQEYILKDVFAIEEEENED